MLSLSSMLSLSFTPELVLRPATRAALARQATPVMGVETELGALGPLGFWDPLGLATKQPEKFARWRAVEVKHGRIAMAATTGAQSHYRELDSTSSAFHHVGYIVQSCLRFPGYLSPSAGVKFADVPNGIAGLKAVPPAGLFQILLFIGLMEGVTWKFYEGPFPGKVPEGKVPGDVADHLWVRYTDPEVKAEKLNIEIQNGRAAMMGSLGMLMHDHITGSWIPPGF